MCPCTQTSNLQTLDWYISTKHIYVSDEYNIWKSPLGNYMYSSINKYYGADINPLFNVLFIYLFFVKCLYYFISFSLLIVFVSIFPSNPMVTEQLAYAGPTLLQGRCSRAIFPLPYQGGKMAIQQNFPPPPEKWLYSGFSP